MASRWARAGAGTGGLEVIGQPPVLLLLGCLLCFASNGVVGAGIRHASPEAQEGHVGRRTEEIEPRMMDIPDWNEETGMCDDIYDENPLEFDPQSPDTCFGGRQMEWAVAAEHKTGTLFSKKLVHVISEYCGVVAMELGQPPEVGDGLTECKQIPKDALSGEAPGPTNYFCHSWNGDLEVRRKELKVVHFVRDPVDVIVSAYNYHKSGHESWTRRAWATHKWPEGWFDGSSSETQDLSYSEGLNQLPLDVGLHLEAHRSTKVIHAMARSYCTHHADPTYLPAMFIDYLGEDAMPNACKVFRFLGMRRKHASALALAAFAPGTGDGDGNYVGMADKAVHVTKGKYDREEQLELVSHYEQFGKFLDVRRALEATFANGGSGLQWEADAAKVSEACAECELCW